MPARNFRVEFTNAARCDLADIRDYVALDKPVAARNLVRRIETQVHGLSFMPERHEWIPERTELKLDLRHTFLGPYRIVYRVKARTVTVMRIIHGARLLDRSFFPEIL